jgi:epoxyqueuosine reductase
MTLSERVKALALEQGAQLAGIAPVDPPAETGYFHEWLAAGQQGGMAYLAKEPDVRTDIRKWYPEAQSVVVCAFTYAGPDDPISASTSSARTADGKIARYAVLPDYHPILKERMARLLDAIRAVEPGADGRVFVDTSPVLEKLFARYAGVGWMGRNTLLIHPRLGSYFFLAGLALNLALDPDVPVADHCGSCRRCIDACPTDAFPEPYRLDASKCIAYFTIEHRGPIPAEHHEAIGDWVFGCDVCQEVCPWNRFAVRPKLDEFREPSMPRVAPLKALAAIGPEEFKPMKKTPVERARWRGWIRNVLLAMGNSDDPTMIEELQPWMTHPDPVLAGQAKDSLERLSARCSR